MPLNQPILIEVFEGTWWEAGLVKSLLEDAQIEVYENNLIRGASAFTHITPGYGGVKLLISSENFAEAEKLIREYESNLKKPS
jgi:hypothetical protein